MGEPTGARRSPAAPPLVEGSGLKTMRLVVTVGLVILGAVTTANAGAQGSPPAAAAIPSIVISAPRSGASYERGARISARFRCSESGGAGSIVACQGTAPTSAGINTRSVGRKSFTVTATDTSGKSVTRSVHYLVWAYVNPLRSVQNLQASRIDMGVDYSGSGPIVAIGSAKVIFASDNVSGPESCWGRTCAPPGSGMVVYRLLDGPFVEKYVYAVENITVSVKVGQTVSQGERIAVLHQGSPNLEIGWAAGHGAETLAVEDEHQCACTDPGGWSSVEGRDFDRLLVWLGAPSGYTQSAPPDQDMPRGWPTLPVRRPTGDSVSEVPTRSSLSILVHIGWADSWLWNLASGSPSVSTATVA